MGEVVSYLRDLGPNSSLSLKQLTRKLVMIMALLQAYSSELAALDLRFRVYKQGVQFKLATLTNKRNPGHPLKEIFFGGFPDDDKLCVMPCLCQAI